MNETRAANSFEGEICDRATSRSSLSTRLALNTRYQSADFHSWLYRRLNVIRGEHILDVGCGTGAQALLRAGFQERARPLVEGRECRVFTRVRQDEGGGD